MTGWGGAIHEIAGRAREHDEKQVRIYLRRIFFRF
jgi:hypothetical protein